MIKYIWYELLGRCKHRYGWHSFSYVKCTDCGKVKYDPTQAATKINNYCDTMVSAGAWKRSEVDKSLLVTSTNFSLGEFQVENNDD